MAKANDPHEVKARDEKQDKIRKQELADIKKLLYTAEGERFFKRILDMGKVFCTTFTGNSYTYFYEGHRNMALQILNDIGDVAPEKIVVLMKRKEEDDD